MIWLIKKALVFNARLKIYQHAYFNCDTKWADVTFKWKAISDQTANWVSAVKDFDSIQKDLFF